ncbi:hypothetical protein [Moritella viscosa]|uniref:Transposase IS116/IS110/IS902 family protein n=1 Tax=Moritella viscosa TaxID=80854 RepID=A0ABY1HJV8_9GAMM|nr:hypothetical protein [Moritella viscosa]SGY81441.1 Transposase IS116/IS110/IS902 family protein [Moritella viscosa]SGZ03323.1 Transposase IS116/IS110/IS902 family protein [Moritella viscosa]SHO23990.1 Transposase IS116/IS110/IS902 family protein [Moritella viscosa]
MPIKFNLDIKESDPDIIRYQNLLTVNRFDLKTKKQDLPDSKESSQFNIACFFNLGGYKGYIVYLLKTAKALISHWSDENIAKMMGFLGTVRKHVDDDLLLSVDGATKRYMGLISESKVDFLNLDSNDHILAALPNKEETKDFKESWKSLVDCLVEDYDLNEMLKIRQIKESNKISKNEIAKKHLYSVLSMHVLGAAKKFKETDPIISDFYVDKVKDKRVNMVGRLLMAHYFLTLALGSDKVQTPDDFLWLRNSKGKNISELKTFTRDLYLKNWVYLYNKENPGAISSQKRLILILEDHFTDFDLSDSMLKRLLKKFRTENYYHQMSDDKRENDAYLLDPDLMRQMMARTHII